MLFLFPKLSEILQSEDLLVPIDHPLDLFAVPLKNLKVKINLQEATDSFNHYRRFILLGRLHPLIPLLAHNQSRETVLLKSIREYSIQPRYPPTASITYKYLNLMGVSL